MAVTASLAMVRLPKRFTAFQWKNLYKAGKLLFWALSLLYSFEFLNKIKLLQLHCVYGAKKWMRVKKSAYAWWSNDSNFIGH
jgi:hypothetical protein